MFKNKIIFSLLMVIPLIFCGKSFALLPPPPVRDSGQIEATILDIYHPANPQIDYGKIRVDKILEYNHDHRANYEALKVDDIISVYFQWGSKKTTVDSSPVGLSDNDINLPGVKIGDKIFVHISGCPEDKGCGNGWTLYKYSVIYSP